MSRAALLAAALLGLAVRPAAGAGIDAQASLRPSIIGLEEVAVLTVEVRVGGFGRLRVRPDFELENLDLVGQPSRAESFRLADGAATRSESVSWRLRPLGPGVGRVIGIRLRLGERTVELPDQQVEIRDAPFADPAARAPLPQGSFGLLQDPFMAARRRDRRGAPKVFLEARAEPLDPWLGQQVVYTLYLYTQGDISAVDPESLPGFQGFWVREIAQGERLTPEMVEVEGERYGRVILLQRALFPLRPGILELEPAQVGLVLRVPERGVFGTFFARTEELERTAQTLRLAVRPLPPAPQGFRGAVGRFDLEAELSPAEIPAGEAAHLRVTLAGEGHLEGLPQPELPELPGLEAFEPQDESSVEVAGTTVRGRRTWSWVLVPHHPGRWRLPPVEVPYFDPEAGLYRTAATRGFELNVVPDPAAAGAEGSGPHPIRSAAVPVATAIRWKRFAPWLFAVPWVAALGLLAARRGTRSPASSRPSSRRLLEARLRGAVAAAQPRQAAAEIEEGWRGFLAERWGLAPGTPTTRWSRELEARGADPTAARELVRLADDLHYLRYAPQLCASEVIRDELVARSRRLLRALS